MKAGLGVSLFVRRDVAQLGRALLSGGRGRQFESAHPDQIHPFLCLTRLSDRSLAFYACGGKIDFTSGCCLMVKLQPSKLITRVRFSPPAPSVIIILSLAGIAQW